MQVLPLLCKYNNILLTDLKFCCEYCFAVDNTQVKFKFLVQLKNFLRVATEQIGRENANQFVAAHLQRTFIQSREFCI